MESHAWRGEWVKISEIWKSTESPGNRVQTRGKEQNHRTMANFYYLNSNGRKGLKRDQKKKKKGKRNSSQLGRKPEKAYVLAATKGCKNSKKQRLGVTSTVFLTDIPIYGLSKTFVCTLP